MNVKKEDKKSTKLFDKTCQKSVIAPRQTKHLFKKILLTAKKILRGLSLDEHYLLQYYNMITLKYL